MQSSRHPRAQNSTQTSQGKATRQKVKHMSGERPCRFNLCEISFKLATNKSGLSQETKGQAQDSSHNSPAKTPRYKDTKTQYIHIYIYMFVFVYVYMYIYMCVCKGHMVSASLAEPSSCTALLLDR